MQRFPLPRRLAGDRMGRGTAALVRQLREQRWPAARMAGTAGPLLGEEAFEPRGRARRLRGRGRGECEVAVSRVAADMNGLYMYP